MRTKVKFLKTFKDSAFFLKDKDPNVYYKEGDTAEIDGYIADQYGAPFAMVILESGKIMKIKIEDIQVIK